LWSNHSQEQFQAASAYHSSICKALADETELLINDQSVQFLLHVPSSVDSKELLSDEAAPFRELPPSWPPALSCGDTEAAPGRGQRLLADSL